MTKLFPLAAAAASLLIGTAGQAATIYNSTTTLSTRSCSTRPAYDAGFIQAAGQTVRINVPERETCSWTPTTRVQSTIRY